MSWGTAASGDAQACMACGRQLALQERVSAMWAMPLGARCEYLRHMALTTAPLRCDLLYTG